MGNFILKKTLIQDPVKQSSILLTVFLVTFISILSSLYLVPTWNFSEAMYASGDLVLKHHQYYRLWTTLFAHADLEHLLSNLLLFVPFALYLTNYFGLLLFPILGIFIGGVVNYLVLITMPLNYSLIGISGVVHWMGATWITLYFLIDRRDRLSSRLLKSSGVAIVLFIPNTFSANISYICHIFGFISGIISGIIYYLIFKKRIRQYELYEYVEEPFFENHNFDIEAEFHIAKD